MILVSWSTSISPPSPAHVDPLYPSKPLVVVLYLIPPCTAGPLLEVVPTGTTIVDVPTNYATQFVESCVTTSGVAAVAEA